MAVKRKRRANRYGHNEWRPADELPDRPFVHRVLAYEGALPHGPRLWRDTVVLLAALGICTRDGRTLRPVPGHERPRGRGRPRKAPPVR